jgi:hypothetical protein
VLTGAVTRSISPGKMRSGRSRPFQRAIWAGATPCCRAIRQTVSPAFTTWTPARGAAASRRGAVSSSTAACTAAAAPSGTFSS